MERKQALIVSAVVTAAAMLVAVVFTLNSTLLDARGDDVGNLKVASTQPAEVTVYVDPATGATALTPPPTTTVPATVPAPGVTSTNRADREDGHDAEHEDEHRDEDGERDD